MNDDQIIELVDFVNASWNVRPTRDELKAQRRAWRIFFNDIEFGTAQQAVADMALTSIYQPRPGELRRRLLAPDLKSGLEAWETLQEIRHNVASGTEVRIQIDPLIREVIRKFGDTAMGLQSNGDREQFIRAYDKAVEEHIQTSCRVK